MSSDTLRETLQGVESLAPHLDLILSRARPSVSLTLTDLPLTNECSRFGGEPFLPKGFVWPDHDHGEYRFLGQINFSEIETSPAVLPNHGLLSLFYAYDEDGEIFWQDDGYVRAFYWDEFTEHFLSTRNSGGTTGIRLKLENCLDVPRRQELCPDWPFDWKTFTELDDAIEQAGAHLLGYPRCNSLGYDPTPGEDWLPFLQVASFDEFDWCWHDGDQLMVFIQRQKLAASDYSSLKSDAG